ncbi:MAG: DinB family protein [Cyclobacteriaceae bacterium]
MKTTISVLTLVMLFYLSYGQTKADEPANVPVWTEADRKYLLDNLIRSKEELIAETKDLTKEQWNFKESPDRWSINQIVEHICLWEVVQQDQISKSLQIGPISSFTNYYPDSVFIEKDTERLEKTVTTDYSKPFTYGVPLGNNEGENNMIWYTTMTNESIDFLQSTDANLRVHYIYFVSNIHQKYMVFFQHTFRHLGQIREVKKHQKYPK